MTKIQEWDYNSDAPVALGLLYRKEAATFERKFEPSRIDAGERDVRIGNFLSESIQRAAYQPIPCFFNWSWACLNPSLAALL